MLQAFSCYLCQLLELSYCAPLEVCLRIHHTGDDKEPSTNQLVTTETTTSTTDYPFIRGEILRRRTNITTDLNFITSTILNALGQDENENNINHYNLRTTKRRGGGVSVAVCGPPNLVTEVCVAFNKRRYYI